MWTLARRVIKQMSRAEKRATRAGNMEPAQWVAERVLNCNGDQAIRVAETIADLLASDSSL